MGGNTGRARKSVTLMALQGTINKSRIRQQGREHAQRLHPGIPSYPPGFSSEAKAAFDYFGKVLDERGVLSQDDGVALGELANAYALLMRARAALAKLGDDTVVADSKGRLKEHPRLRQTRNLQRDLSHWLSRFGMTPRDRERVVAIAATEIPNANDPWNKLERKN